MAEATHRQRHLRRQAPGLSPPLPGERTTPEQAGSVQEPRQNAAAGWGFYIIADLKTWADNAAERSELEHFSSFEAAKARFDELRGEPCNSEAVEPGPDQMALAAAGFSATFSDNAAVQKLAASLMAEVAQYNEPGQADVPRN